MKAAPLGLIIGFFLAPAARADMMADAVKTAVERGLRRVAQGAASYTTHRQCFSCHHQAMSILAMTSARPRGFPVEPDKVRQQIDFTVNTFKPKKDQILKGQGVPGGNTMAAYALVSLQAAGHPADETTDALVQYLLGRQRPDGSWPAVSNRPPTEGSTFTNNALALRSLRAYGPSKDAKDTEQLRGRIGTALANGKEWLLKNKPKTTEDKVFHLRGLVFAEADQKQIEAARQALVKEQRDDGSWAQLPELSGDAYATATVLVAVRAAGMEPTDPVYQQGVAYLLQTQKPDGSWLVETRSRPVQVFFDNGDPGGKSQFISFAATNWALLALLEVIPVR
jgi:N-acyl-D-amino-acid deacylase